MGILKYRSIITERLLLRELRDEDYDRQFQYLSDKNNFPFADYKVAANMHDASNFLARMIQDQLKTSLFWVVSERYSEISIGTISAWNVDFAINSIEFGFSLYPDYRGKGYMEEALTAVMEYCHNELGFTVMDIWTAKENCPSRRLAEQLGYRFEGYENEPAKYSQGEITYAKYRKIFD